MVRRRLVRVLSSSFVLLGGAALSMAQEGSLPPTPYGAVPSARQRAWHEYAFYGFLHFTTNTFTDREWGYGDEDVDVFQPSDFDAASIVAVAKAAGMTGLILTAKHHDGFCLWDSATTTHDVASSSWKDGRVDVVRAFAEACREGGIGFGVYLSPWDRNHPEYGRPAYVDAFHAQLEELLRGYGELFEVWFDGANGGDGYYGGARETRRIDRGSYYRWDEVIDLVRALQPNACIFSDAGPDVRWIGNESGQAGDPCWHTYSPRPREGESKAAPGTTRYQEGFHGHADGALWIPGEVDVSIRPGWFFHESQNERVRSVENLVDLWFGSVGRGTSLLLNVPPDRRGRIHPADERALRSMGKVLYATFAVNLADGARARASETRGNDARFSPEGVLDARPGSYWATEDATHRAELVLELPEVRVFDVVDLREEIALGQRVRRFAVDAWVDGAWNELATGESLGARRLLRFRPTRTDRVRLRIESAAACPAIRWFALHREPVSVSIRAEQTSFLDSTTVRLSCADERAVIHYTTDGSQPMAASPIYREPLIIHRSGRIRACARIGEILSPRESALELEAWTKDGLLAPVEGAPELVPGLVRRTYLGGFQTLDGIQDRAVEREERFATMHREGLAREEHVGLVFDGFLRVERSDVFEFALVSDDGSRLYVDDRLVVDHDGLHGASEKRGRVGLATGLHRLRVEWFNASGGAALHASQVDRTGEERPLRWLRPR